MSSGNRFTRFNHSLNGRLLLTLALQPLQLAHLGLQQLQLGFRIGLEGHIQVFSDELAQVMVGATVFLLLKCG